MKKNKLMVFTATLLLSSAGFISTASADVTLKHGYIDTPPSRAFLCSAKGKNLNKDCGPIQYEPQSIEGVKDFLKMGLLMVKLLVVGKKLFLL